MAGFLKFASIALKNLFSEPATRNYPDLPPKSTASTRGSVKIDIEACVFCGLCMRRCPSEAIKVDRNGKSWSIERMGCVQCADCVSVCPKQCLSMDPKYTPPSSQKTVDTYRKAEPEATPEEMVAKEKSNHALLMNIENCVLCGLCVKQCPVGAITVDRAAKSWTIDRSACLICGACAQRCPKKCLTAGEVLGALPPSVYTKSDAIASASAETSDGGQDIPTKNGATVREDASASALLMNLENCVFCGLCAKQCPAEAIKIDRAAKSWTIDRTSCLLCGACVERCPKKSLRMGIGEELPTVYTKEIKTENASTPAVKQSEPPSALLIGIENCVLCGMCVKQCPVGAITVDRAAKSWSIDRTSCLLCGACVQRCPRKCLGVGQASETTMQTSIYTKA